MVWSSLISRLLSCRKTGREPGRSDHMPHDIPYVVLCMILMIGLLPTQPVLVIVPDVTGTTISNERLFHYYLARLKLPVWYFKYSFYCSANWFLRCHDVVLSGKQHRTQLPNGRWQHWLLLTMSTSSLWKASVNSCEFCVLLAAIVHHKKTTCMSSKIRALFCSSSNYNSLLYSAEEVSQPLSDFN